jgi:hypothetical protein
MLIETLESRELMSVTPAAPSPLPVPYPVVADADADADALAKKKKSTPKPQSAATFSDFNFTHNLDKASPVLM